MHPGQVDQRLADLLGLDPTDPEVIANEAILDREEREQDAAIVARVRDVLTRTGTTEGAFVALLGITADKARASLAGDRRFSTYELAVIAEHGGTTVEWLCGEDEPAEPDPRTQAVAAELRAERTATPERDGYTIGVYLPPGVSATVREYLSQAIGDVAHTADWHQGWDAHVVGVAGDPMGAVDGQVRP